MIEEKILSEAYKRISQGKRVALVMVTEAVGSTPRKSGAMMGVFEDSIIGTIGGGNIEYKVIQNARELINSGESKEFSYNLTTDDELRMNCGGSMKG